MPGRLLALALSLSAPQVAMQGEARHIDPDAVRRGLALRLDDSADRWAMSLSEGENPNLVRVDFRSPLGNTFERSVTLTGQTVEDRSRELAASIAIIIQEYEEKHPEEAEPEPQPEPQPQPEPEPKPVTTGWIALGGRLGVGPPGDAFLDGGLSLRGGTWVLRDILQPIVAVEWGRTNEDSLTLDAVRFGGGLFLGWGELLDRRLWLGGGATVQAAWLKAVDESAPTTWTSVTQIAGLAQYRGRILVAGIRLGVDVLTPRVEATGQEPSVQIRWTTARFAAGIELGVRIPPLLTQ